MINENYHIHTTYSDGRSTVSEIIEKLLLSGIKSFAITDHDCLDANAEAAQLARIHGMAYFNGIELSCCFSGEAGLDATALCHIVGLNFDISKMEQELEKQAQIRQGILEELLSQLNLDGYNLNTDKVIDKKGRINRTKIGIELIKKKYAFTLDEAFSKILNSDKYRKYAANFPNISEGIHIIHKCGGIAVWAHPFSIICGGKKEITEAQVKSFSLKMKEYQIDAVEVYYQNHYYPGYNVSRVAFLEKLSKNMKWLKSVATDFHGTNNESLVFSISEVRSKPDIFKKLATERSKSLRSEIERLKESGPNALEDNEFLLKQLFMELQILEDKNH